MGFILLALVLVNVLRQIDRIPPFILAETIKRDLSLADTRIGLLTAWRSRSAARCCRWPAPRIGFAATGESLQPISRRR